MMAVEPYELQHQVYFYICCSDTIFRKSAVLEISICMWGQFSTDVSYRFGTLFDVQGCQERFSLMRSYRKITCLKPNLCIVGLLLLTFRYILTSVEWIF